MVASRSDLVELIRDFLSVHERLSILFDRFRGGRLRFEDVRKLVGDSPESLLFRLKERCHLLFRIDDPAEALAAPRPALFDLAVGSLFHEAMKLRENLYQTEIYAPKVKHLQGAAGGESDDLFRDFEKILSAAAGRLEEALTETEALLGHTRTQFRLLLCDFGDEPVIARTLYVNRQLVAKVFPDGLDCVLARIYGSAVNGYVAAGRSFLDSAYFDEAIEVLAEAETRSGESEGLAGLAAFSEGMQAFLSGEYEACLERLEAWADSSPDASQARYARLAATALSRLDTLTVDAAEDRRRSLGQSARALLPRLSKLADREAPARGGA